MPKLKNRLPAMKLHKKSGQSVVWFGGRCHYLGKHGSPEAQEKYDRLMVGWIEARKANQAAAAAAPAVLSVAELLVRFVRHAREYYRNRRGEPTGEAKNLVDACKPLHRLFGSRPVADFTPDDLETVRKAMIQKGLARTTINDRVNRVRRVFKWGVSKGIVPETVFRSLLTVQGLREGRTSARESAKIRAVPIDRVHATLPHLSPIVAAMVQVQFLTGCRPTEIAILRPRDIDRSRGDTWDYLPEFHKTEHHEIARVIPIGPRAQAILEPLLSDAPPDEYLFSPRKTVEALRSARLGGRSQRTTADRYDRRTYRQAVVRGCDRAFPHPTLSGMNPEAMTAEQKAELKVWRKRHRWSPNQLRKARATEIRRKHGLEAAQKVLGHAKADVTQLYAETNVEEARRMMRDSG